MLDDQNDVAIGVGEESRACYVQTEPCDKNLSSSAAFTVFTIFHVKAAAVICRYCVKPEDWFSYPCDVPGLYWQAGQRLLFSTGLALGWLSLQQATQNVKQSLDYGTNIIGGVKPGVDGEHLGLPVCPSVMAVSVPKSKGFFDKAFDADYCLMVGQGTTKPRCNGGVRSSTFCGCRH